MRALRKRGKALGVAAACTGLLVYAAVAIGDQIERTIENGVGANVTVAPGGSANVDYWVRAQGGNPPSCDATTDPVTVTINLPPGGGVAITKPNGDPLAGANANQLVFNSCDEANAQRVKFTPAGGDGSSYAIPAVSESSSGAGSYSTGGTAFTLNVVASSSGDTTGPEITIVTPPDDAVYLLNQVVNADYSCTDGSGVASCVGDVATGTAIATGTIGPKTFTVNAEDTLGNTSSLTHDYSVIFDFDGFFRPVDNNGILNKAKAGSAIPLKFSLGGDQGLGVIAAGFPKSQAIICDPLETVDPIEELATINPGQSSLSYDPVTEQYNYVWKTDKSFANGTGCRQLVLKLTDDEEYRANFKFTK